MSTSLKTRRMSAARAAEFGSIPAARTAADMLREDEEAAARSTVFAPPVGSRFMNGLNPQLTVNIISCKNLPPFNSDGCSADPFVRIKHAYFKFKTHVVKDSLDPKFDESTSFEVFNPMNELLIIEVFDKDTFGRKNFIGFVPVELTLLPKGKRVTTTEKLSYASQGEITYSLTSDDFGLDNVDAAYVTAYSHWRSNLPTTGPTKDKKKDSKKSGKEATGPYGGKFVPKGYVIENGHVIRTSTNMGTALGKTMGAMKGLLKFGK